VYLNSNEHKRAVIEVETREARFVADCRRRYPLHNYQRLARLMHRLRIVKSPPEIEIIRKASEITEQGVRRVLRFVKPGVTETEVEAEFAHEFIRRNGNFAYPPIIATGGNACVLHYLENSAQCRAGEFAAARCRRRIRQLQLGPDTHDSGSAVVFLKAQRQIYNAVLRVFRRCVQGSCRQAGEGVAKEAEQMTRRSWWCRPPDHAANPAAGCGESGLSAVLHARLGHPIDWMCTTSGSPPNRCNRVGDDRRAGNLIREENLGVRLENTIVIGEESNIDLMSTIPLEADEIEAAMRGAGANPPGSPPVSAQGGPSRMMSAMRV
jgi:Xaa-Pro aminopeptidase